MKTPTFRQWMAPLALGGMLFIQGIVLAVWLKKDTRPPQWDPAVHLMSAQHYSDEVARGNWGALLLTPTFPGHPPYPPVAHYVMAMGMGVARGVGVPVEDCAVFCLQMFSLGVLAVGCFLVAGQLWGRSAGLAAAALSVFAPPVQYLSHQALVDVALAAVVVLAYGCWFRSEGFSRFRWSLGFGVVAGVGCLVKWTFPSYMLPVVFSGVWGLLKGRSRANILFALLVSILLAVPWYVANLMIVVPKLTRVAGLGAQEGDPSGKTWAGWVWYVRVFWLQWGGPFMLASVAGLVWGFFRRSKGTLSLVFWLVSSYAVWSLVSNKDPRYLLPAAMVLPLSLSSLPWGIPLLAALVCAYLSVSSLWAGSRSGSFRDPPVSHHWPLAEMLENVLSYRAGEAGVSTLVLISNEGYLNGNNMTWTVKSRGWTDRVTVRTKTDRLGEFTDFVIVKTGSLGPAGSVTRQLSAREDVLSESGWFQKAYSRAAHWSLPDGSEGVLFVRNPVTVPLKGDVSLEGWMGTHWDGARFVMADSKRFSGSQQGEISASQLSFKSVALRNVVVGLDGLRLVADNDGRPRLLDLKETTIRSAEWTESDALAFLKKKVPPIKDAKVTFEKDGRIALSGHLGVLPISLVARLDLLIGEKEDILLTHLMAVKVGGLSVPRFFLQRYGKRTISLCPTPRRPFGVRLAGLKTEPLRDGKEGRLVVAP
ncbi:MAG: glycosyltransferase family 39 protein [Elusimicrobia bacterium]|nr:glycosyltransferase family 39 protein [Elusimicrobiota bacterium]